MKKNILNFPCFRKKFKAFMNNFSAINPLSARNIKNDYLYSVD